MFKSKLQELCQRFSVPRPDYSTVREGPDHDARFNATVTVNGLPFHSTPNKCRSSKEAQNLAARFAFEYFSANPPEDHPPQLFPGISPNTQSHQAQAFEASPTPVPANLAPDPAVLTPELQHNLASTYPQPFKSLMSSSISTPQSAKISSFPPGISTPQPVKSPNSSLSPPGISTVVIYPLLPSQTLVEGPSFQPPISTAPLPGPQPQLHLLQQTGISKDDSTPNVLSTPNANTGQSKDINAQLPTEENASVKGVYKSKLQELCRKYSWNQPEYKTVKEGPDHIPQFTATVIVNGVPYVTPHNHSRSSKDATNLAARVAFEHLTTRKPIVSQEGIIPSGLVKEECNEVHGVNANPLGSDEGREYKDHTEVKVDQNNERNGQTSGLSSTPLVDREIKKSPDVNLFYKNQLQHYVQKQGIALPEYSCETEGPPHNRRFRPRVTVAGNVFENQQFFSTLKEAEQEAARIALVALSPNEIQKGVGLYKTLLQQLAQKLGSSIPMYKTIQSGPPHASCFESTVVVCDETYQGQAAKSKKQAEMNAAEVAYNSWIKRADVFSKRQKTSTTPGTHIPHLSTTHDFSFCQ